MKNTLIKLIAVLIFSMPFKALADDFTIKLSSSPSPTEISIEIVLNFDQPTVIYHWSHGKSIYPIMNSGLFVQCHNLDSNQNIAFMPYEKVMPKFPHELDVLKIRKYKENLKIVPGENYHYSSLEKGKYSLKLIYDTEALRKYPGGKELTPMKIESNEIFFEINV
jgi:hypothetical protein